MIIKGGKYTGPSPEDLAWAAEYDAKMEKASAPKVSPLEGIVSSLESVGKGLKSQLSAISPTPAPVAPSPFANTNSFDSINSMTQSQLGFNFKQGDTAIESELAQSVTKPIMSKGIMESALEMSKLPRLTDTQTAQFDTIGRPNYNQFGDPNINAYGQRVVDPKALTVSDVVKASQPKKPAYAPTADQQRLMDLFESSGANTVGAGLYELGNEATFRMLKKQMRLDQERQNIYGDGPNLYTSAEKNLVAHPTAGKVGGAIGGVAKMIGMSAVGIPPVAMGFLSGAVGAFNEDKSLAEILKAGAMEAITFGVGVKASKTLGPIASKLLQNTPLKNTIMGEVISKLISGGVGFGAVGTASQDIAAHTGTALGVDVSQYDPSLSDYGTNMLMGALFEAIPATIGAIKIAPYNRAAVKVAVGNYDIQMKSYWRQMMDVTSQDQKLYLIDKMIKLNADARTVLNNVKVTGASKEAKFAVKAFDIVEANLRKTRSDAIMYGADAKRPDMLNGGTFEPVPTATGGAPMESSLQLGAGARYPQLDAGQQPLQLEGTNQQQQLNAGRQPLQIGAPTESALHPDILPYKANAFADKVKGLGSFVPQTEVKTPKAIMPPATQVQPDASNVEQILPPNNGTPDTILPTNSVDDIKDTSLEVIAKPEKPAKFTKGPVEISFGDGQGPYKIRTFGDIYKGLAVIKASNVKRGASDEEIAKAAKPPYQIIHVGSGNKLAETFTSPDKAKKYVQHLADTIDMTGDEASVSKYFQADEFRKWSSDLAEFFRSGSDKAEGGNHGVIKRALADVHVGNVTPDAIMSKVDYATPRARVHGFDLEQRQQIVGAIMDFMSSGKTPLDAEQTATIKTYIEDLRKSIWLDQRKLTDKNAAMQYPKGQKKFIADLKEEIMASEAKIKLAQHRLDTNDTRKSITIDVKGNGQLTLYNDYEGMAKILDALGVKIEHKPAPPKYTPKQEQTQTNGDKPGQTEWKEEVTKALEYAKTNLQGKTFINKDTGMSISISRDGIDKTFSTGVTKEKLETIHRLPEFIMGAKKIDDKPETKGRKGINKWHYFAYPLEINGKQYTVTLDVKGTDLGDKFYLHRILLKEDPSRERRFDDESSIHAVSPERSSNNDSIPQTVKNNNTQNKPEQNVTAEEFKDLPDTIEELQSLVKKFEIDKLKLLPIDLQKFAEAKSKLALMEELDALKRSKQKLYAQAKEYDRQTNWIDAAKTYEKLLDADKAIFDKLKELNKIVPNSKLYLNKIDRLKASYEKKLADTKYVNVWKYILAKAGLKDILNTRLTAQKKKYEAKLSAQKNNYKFKLENQKYNTKQRIKDAQDRIKYRKFWLESQRKKEAELRKEVNKMLKDLRSLDLKHMLPQYRDAVNGILSTLDLRAKSITKSKIAALQKLQAYIAVHPDNEVPDNIKREIARLSQMQVSKMSIEDLRKIYATAMTLVNMEALKSKLIINGKRRDFKVVKDEALASLSARPDRITRDPKRISTRDEDIRLTTRSGFVYGHVKPEIIAIMADGKMDGAFKRILYDNINAGTSIKLRFYNDAVKPVADYVEKLGKSVVKKWSKMFSPNNKKVTTEIINLTRGVTLEVTPAEKMWFYLAAKDIDAKRAIIEAGFSFEDSLSVRHRITEEDLNIITSSLTPEEVGMADIFTHYFREVARPAINKVHLSLNLWELMPENKNYIPIYRHPDSIARDFDRPKYKQISLENTRYMKERVNNKHGIVIADIFEVAHDHMLFASSYVGMAEPLRNAKKLINDEDIKTAFRRKNFQLWKQLNFAIKNLEAEFTTPNPIDTVSLQLLRGWTVSVLGLNPGTIAKQFISIFSSMTDVNPALMVKGTFEKADYAEIEKYSPILAERFEGNVNIELGEERKVGLSKSAFLRERGLRQKSTYGIVWADKRIIATTWNAVKHEIHAKQPTLTGDDLLNAVARRTEQVVRDNNSSSQAIDRPSMVIDDSVQTKLMTRFTSESNAQLNRLIRATLEYNYGDKSAGAKAQLAWVAIISIFVTAVLESLITYGTNKIKRNAASEESFASQAQTNIIVTAARKIYGIGPLVEVILGKIKKGTYSGYDYTTPIVQLMNDITVAVADLYTWIQKEFVKDERYKSGPNRGEWKSDIMLKKVLDEAFSIITRSKGVPYNVIKSYLTGIYKIITGGN